MEKDRRFGAAVWRPLFVNAATDLTLVEEPKKAMGLLDDGWITANRDFLRTAPNALRYILSELHMEIETIETLDTKVTIKNSHLSDVALDWLGNNVKLVDKLISDSSNAAVGQIELVVRLRLTLLFVASRFLCSPQHLLPWVQCGHSLAPQDAKDRSAV